MENENGGVRDDIKLHREGRRGSLNGTRLNGAHDQAPKSSRKLVLHFDIRNTILVADSVTNVDVDEALNTYLAGVTWGFPTADGWRWCSDTPSLKPPQKGAVTYYKYLEDRLVNERFDRTRLRKETGGFTQAEIGRRFQPYFAKHLQVRRFRFSFAFPTVEGSCFRCSLLKTKVISLLRYYAFILCHVLAK